MTTILITGATDGLGLELARLYQQQAARLILVGRRPLLTLDDPLFTEATYCQADLTHQDCADVVYEWLQTHDVQHLDLLIHNAGVGYYGDVAAQSPTNIQELVAVNLRAPVELTHRLLPYIERGSIVFINSVVAELPAPEYAVYAATKAALDGFAASLRIEVRTDTQVQVIYPGATRTGMHAKSGIPLEAMRWDEFPPAAETAVRIAAQIAARRPRATIGLSNRLLRFGGRHLSGIVDRLIRRRAQS
jgi:short-subunit dehydrogenase